jgi:hypothetical protein
MRNGKIGAPAYRWPIRILLGTLALVSAGLIAVTLLNYETTARLAGQSLQNDGMTMALEVASERAPARPDAGALQAVLAGQHRRRSLISRSGSATGRS